MKLSDYTKDFINQNNCNDFIKFTKNINLFKNINFNLKFRVKQIKPFNNLIKSRFIPNEIFYEINKFDNCISFSIDNLNISLFSQNCDDNFIKKQIKFIKILACINKHFQDICDLPNPNKTIFISIYFSEFLKKLPNNKIISPININSGLSYVNPSGFRNIIIFRQEEWKKLFIHELIHSYQIDNFQFTTIPFINGKDMEYESITEFFTLIIHSRFISHLTKINFNKILAYEIMFSISQAQKLLLFWNVKNIKELQNKKITVSSSPFSYFLYKLELILNYNNYKNIITINKTILPEINLDNFYDYTKININNNQNNSLKMTIFNIE